MPWDMLWAGWRSEYIVTAGEPDADGCLFCRLPAGDDEETLILERGAFGFAVLNRYPYTTGHVMVAPYRHIEGPAELNADEQADLWRLLGNAMDAIDTAMHPDGYNLGANLGRVAGAGVPGHFHLHLVPRWSGDANFMTTVGDTRVLPEDLTVTWARLRAASSRARDASPE
ncbi:AP-4-A phosphorylase [bacterium BMS3Abin02]|nr:AP-4-A phosphorylase [bacterium BMS3Abin02]GBE22801.1 AP-4-A phosphorylase [bacterium BMS3Bbin01]